MSETKAETKWTHDKSKLPPGPWKDEPDRVAFEAHGFACVALRPHASTGNLCGYVGVPEGHPWHGKDYDRIGADAHGGLTYAAKARWPVTAGDDDRRWWVGFDCAHLGDLVPGLGSTHYYDSAYRDLAWVRDETERLAEQAAVAARGES
jgi:hypothetical protein